MPYPRDLRGQGSRLRALLSVVVFFSDGKSGRLCKMCQYTFEISIYTYVHTYICVYMYADDENDMIRDKVARVEVKVKVKV